MKDYKGSDPKAPRFRKTSTQILTVEFFKEFKAKYPQFKHLSEKELRSKIKLLNRNLWRVAVQERDGVELPNGLGSLFLGTCQKRKRKAQIDYALSTYYKKQIESRNFESDNHLLKVFYTNYGQKYTFRNHTMWGFKGAREFCRSASEAYEADWKKYIEVEPYRKISDFYSKRSYKMYKKKKTSKDLESHDEFNLS